MTKIDYNFLCGCKVYFSGTFFLQKDDNNNQVKRRRTNRPQRHCKFPN